MSTVKVVEGRLRCAQHGEYSYKAYAVGEKVVGRECPDCLKVMQEKAATFNAAQAASAELSKRRKSLSMAGVPDLFLDSTLDNYEVDARTKTNLSFCRGYAMGFRMALEKRPATGLIFVGVSGTGKTHLACSIIRRIMDDGFTAAYARVPELLMEIEEATFGRSDSTATQKIDTLSRPHLLVLDEYGAHTLKEAYYQHLFSIIEGRYQRNLPTILITNKTAADLGKELDARIMERILGNTSGSVLSFNWTTHRMKK